MPVAQSMVGGGGAWEEPADVALLHEVAALFNPSGGISGGGFATPSRIQQQQQQPQQQEPSSQLVATAHYDADEELATINELMDAHIQQVHYQQQYQRQQSLFLFPDGQALSPVRVSVPPPPSHVVAPRDASAPPTAVLSSASPPLTIQPIAAKPVTKTTRERQKEELMSLRAEAAELEAQLKSHKELHREIVVIAPAVHHHQQQRGSSTGKKDASSWWARAADHQLNEKRRAEEENNRLREMALGQLRLAKSLEKVLEKRRVSSPFCHFARESSDGQAANVYVSVFLFIA